MAPASAMAAFAAALILATAAAADTGTTTTSPPPTAVPTTTVGPTTTAPAPTTTAAPTTTETATTTTEAARPSSTSTSAAAEATSAQSLTLARACRFGAVALLERGRLPLLVGPVASAPSGAAGLSRLVYPADGSIVSGSHIGIDARACGGAGPRGSMRVGSVSLFDGAVKSALVDLRLGKDSNARVTALTIAGRRVAAAAGARVPLGRWGSTSSRRWVRRLLLSQVERSTGSDGKSSAAGAKAPHPAHPPLPSDPALNKEARYVFRELLAARHLIRHPPKPTERPKIKVPAGANGRPIAAPPLRSSAARVPVDHSSQGGGAGVTTAIALLAGCLMLAATAAFLVPVLRRRGRRREAEEAAESTNEDG